MGKIFSRLLGVKLIRHGLFNIIWFFFKPKGYTKEGEKKE